MYVCPRVRAVCVYVCGLYSHLISNLQTFFPTSLPLTIVILVLHGLLGLGLNEQLASEANLLLVLHHHLEEGAHVIQLSLQVCVQQSLVALTASPEH